MEEPNDELHEKQKLERRYGVGSGWTALGCIDVVTLISHYR
jgi:hypothetical protein